MDAARPTDDSIRVLIVDDDRGQAQMLGRLLDLEGFTTETTFDPEAALARAQAWRPQVVVSDYRMPKLSGLELFYALKEKRVEPIFIIVTAFGTLDTAVDAMRAGVHDFATKPVDVNLLTLRIKSALRVRTLESENHSLRATIDHLHEGSLIVGNSPALAKVMDRIQQVAGSSATVLVQGESGTGKELVARTLHLRSPRRAGPFIAVNCSAIPETLMEDELFGHVKGAFTGAASDRKGRFELAHHGTLFLDEIGDLPLALQPKLLRVLQERQFEKVGAGVPISVDVRVVAATHRDLRQMVQEGKFREDLYWRLNVIPIPLPPLRERGSDVVLLARHFLKRFSAENGRKLRGFSTAAEEELLRHPWPGNVRELENSLERAVLLAPGEQIEPEDLGLRAEKPPAVGIVNSVMDSIAAHETTLENLERDVIAEALRRASGNVSRAARTLGLTRRTLQYRVEKMREPTQDGSEPGEPSS